jgi:hypothetical protein
MGFIKLQEDIKLDNSVDSNRFKVVEPDIKLDPGSEKTDIKQTISTFARPLLEGALGAGGAIIGTPAGPFGTVGGAGLGFAIGAELADKLDEFLNIKERQPLSVELAESAKDVGLGASFEMGGQAAVVGGGAALKWIAKKLPNMFAFTSKKALQQAGDVIAANTTGGPIIAKNIDEARMLEETIPGLKFSRGQLTGDAKVIRFEKGQAAMSGEIVNQQEAQVAQNSQAIKDFINKAKGPAGIDEPLQAIATQKAQIDSGVDLATSQLQKEAGSLGQRPGVIESGQKIRGVAKVGEKTARTAASELYKEVPEFGIDASQLIKEIEDLSKPLNKFEDIGKNIPDAFPRVKELLEDAQGVVTPQDLQGLRSSLTDSLRDIQTSANPNGRMTSRISKMISKVDDVLDQASESGLRVSREKIKHSFPSADDFKEYDLISSKANQKATENISKTVSKEDATAYKEVYEQAKEIIDASDDFSDWTDLIKSGGLNLETAHMMSDKETIKELLLRRPTLFRRGAQTHAEHFAMDKGFDTPDELFQSWLNKKPRQDAIKDLADEMFNDVQVGKELGDDLIGDGYKEFINQSIDETNKLLLKKSPKGAFSKEVQEVVRTRQIPGDEQAAQKLKTAQKFFKDEVIKKFREGPVGDILKKVRSGDKVSDAQVASTFFRPGPVGEESAGRFMNAIGDDPQAKQAIIDYAKQDLLTSATNPVTGELTEAKLKTWLSKFGPAIKRIGIEDEFDSIVKARARLSEAIETKVAFDKSEASKMLNADVDKAIASAFKSGSKRDAASGLMFKLQGDKKAVSGVQNSLIDHIIEKAKNTGVDMAGNRIVSMAKLTNLMKEFKPAMDVMFKDAPQKVKALENYQKAFAVLQRDQIKAAGGGSNTMDKMVSVLQAMKSVSSSRIVNIGSAILKPFKDISNKNINTFLNRAAFDPDFAFTLQLMASDMPPDMIAQRLKGNFAALGLRYRTEKDKQND